MDFPQEKASNRTKAALLSAMLIEFKVANYRSIRAEQTLSMVANADKELPQNLISCDHVPGLKGTKLVKAVALYGANASGKSNIVAALRFFAEFVRDSATKLQPGAPTGTQPFKLDPKCQAEPSKFEITAVINGVRTLYGLELTRGRVTSEYLVAYPNGKPQRWFERDWDAANEKYEWSKSTVHFKHDAALREKTRENAAFVSVAAQFAVEGAGYLIKWIEALLEMIDLERHSQGGLLVRMMVGRDDSRKRITKALRTADLGIADVSVRKATQPDLVALAMRSVYREAAMAVLKGPNADSMNDAFDKLEGKIYTTQLLHKACDGSTIQLDFDEEESLGTRRYFELLGYMDMALTLNRLVVFDEVEASLHPLLVFELLKSLFVGTENPSNAQLLFTTHNPLLLDQTLLRRDQIWFTEKDQEGATRLYPLTDFKPRKDESLVKGYLAGRYGGIPFIPEGLKF